MSPASMLYQWPRLSCYSELISGFLGLGLPDEAKIEAVMSRPMHSSMGVDQFVRVTLGGWEEQTTATPSGEGAGSVMSMVRADGS